MTTLDQRSVHRNNRKVIRDQIVEMIGPEAWAELLTRVNHLSDIFYFRSVVKDMDENRLVSAAAIRNIFATVTEEQVERMANKKPHQILKVADNLVVEVKEVGEKVYKANRGLKSLHRDYDKEYALEMKFKSDMNSMSGAVSTPKNMQVTYNKANHQKLTK